MWRSRSWEHKPHRGCLNPCLTFHGTRFHLLQAELGIKVCVNETVFYKTFLRYRCFMMLWEQDGDTHVANTAIRVHRHTAESVIHAWCETLRIQNIIIKHNAVGLMLFCCSVSLCSGQNITYHQVYVWQLRQHLSGNTCCYCHAHVAVFSDVIVRDLPHRCYHDVMFLPSCIAKLWGLKWFGSSSLEKLFNWKCICFPNIFIHTRLLKNNLIFVVKCGRTEPLRHFSVYQG